MNFAPPRFAALRFACGASLGGLLAATAGAQYPEPPPPSPPSFPSVPTERAWPARIFFPPFPPPLDVPVTRTVFGGGATNAPQGLGQYTGELFYPQLSSHLAAKTLNRRLTQSLADYRAARQALATEIEQTLAAARDDEPEARRGKLQALAQRQAARLAALEKTAEQLRGDLIAGDRNWSDFREWHLGDRERRGFSPVEIGMVMRAAAHYQKGLLPQQRRMLREIAVELALAAESAEKAAAASSHVFFSPDAARVMFPADAPAPVAARIAAYLTKKSLVKKDLYDAIYQADGKTSLFFNPLHGIAEKQARAIAELEGLAEEIRVGLAPLTRVPPPLPRSPLPQSLTSKITELGNRRAALQREATTRLEDLLERVRRDHTPVRVNYRFDDTGLKFVIVPVRGKPADTAIEKLREELTAISEDFGRALAEQINVGLALRQNAADLLGNNDPRSVENAIAQSLRVAGQQETEAPYRRYRVAVFEPGLSPEQRRLLFDLSIEALNLPLPRGELQPQRRTGSW